MSVLPAVVEALDLAKVFAVYLPVTFDPSRSRYYSPGSDVFATLDEEMDACGVSSRQALIYNASADLEPAIGAKQFYLVDRSQTNGAPARSAETWLALKIFSMESGFSRYRYECAPCERMGRSYRIGPRSGSQRLVAESDVEVLGTIVRPVLRIIDIQSIHYIRCLPGASPFSMNCTGNCSIYPIALDEDSIHSDGERSPGVK